MTDKRPTPVQEPRSLSQLTAAKEVTSIAHGNHHRPFRILCLHVDRWLRPTIRPYLANTLRRGSRSLQSVVDANKSRISRRR